MTEPTDPRPGAQILLFRQAARRPAVATAGNPIGQRPISRGERFVYDVVAEGARFAVTFQGAAITRHDSRDAAIENARLIASNFWNEGIRTAVRWVDGDGAIEPLMSFG